MSPLQQRRNQKQLRRQRSHNPRLSPTAQPRVILLTQVNQATTATSSSTFNYSSISNTPYYEERHERALTYGDDRVVLSGQQSYARLGEAHRVSSMFEYPPAHNTYNEEQSEHHEEDESNEQVLLHEYDSGSDYDEVISIGYYSDDH